MHSWYYCRPNSYFSTLLFLLFSWPVFLDNILLLWFISFDFQLVLYFVSASFTNMTPHLRHSRNAVTVDWVVSCISMCLNIGPLSSLLGKKHSLLNLREPLPTPYLLHDLPQSFPSPQLLWPRREVREYRMLTLLIN